MIQKRYIDIENLIEHDTDLKQANCYGFEKNDFINISEKIDGSSACCAYDEETDSLVAFSRNKELNYANTLNGFWNYVQLLDPAPYKAHPNWRVFGEWSGARNKIVYDERFKNKWIVYSIWDTSIERWLDQTVVKDFCKFADLEYIHVFYEGPFISWDHCRSFLKSPHYGDRQEGIVVRNLSKLNDDSKHLNWILKIVNDDFKETKIKKRDPDKDKMKSESQILAETIITENRVEKMLYKLRDEGILPDKMRVQDMGLVAKVLPKAIYEDCLKEEKETVMACGQYFSKVCSQLTMKNARKIILGQD